MSIQDIASAVHGTIHVDGDVRVNSVSIDSRTMAAGDLFIAIRGPVHDGHVFCDDAASRGAKALLVERPIETTCPAILVDDTTVALGRLAAADRRGRGFKLVAITGSSGKTTTKELVGRALSSRFETSVSPGNLNNHWGLPLSLLRIPDDTQAAVVELGMNHAGEIAALTRIASPDVGLITNVGSAHIGFFNSEKEIANAKGELLDELPDGSIGIINADCSLLTEIAERWTCPLRTFSLDARADFRAENVRSDLLDGTRFTVRDVDVHLQLWGRHAAINATAAMAVAHELGADLSDAAREMGRVEPLDGRGRIHRLDGRRLLIDESYNANPSAVKTILSAIDASSHEGRRIAVLGDMLELGDRSAEFHRQVGETVARTGFDQLVAVGAFAGDMAEAARRAGLRQVQTFDDSEAALEHVTEAFSDDTLVVVKGSRGIRLDRIVSALTPATAGGDR